MTRQFPKLIPFAILGGLILTLTAGVIPAQQPLPQLPPPGAQVAAQPADPDGMDVLTRGPVHEAFATTSEQTVATPVVPKGPPEPIEELPPDQKPEGDNVQWMPGYWHWDDDADQFIWISGFWRAVPPNKEWVSGYWAVVGERHQWVSGFWASTEARAVDYLPQPPESVELGPSTEPPSENHVWTPGCWMCKTRTRV